MRRLIATMVAMAGVLAGAVQAQAPAPAPAAPKIAISSLVGDALTVAFYRESTVTRLSNATEVLKMPGPLLDIGLLKVAREAVIKAAPGAEVFPLKVPVAGSNVDPAAVVGEDNKVVAGNVLVDALRQQGFTHLLIATKYKHNNVVRLADGAINTGKGQLEGLGFYIDPTIRVENRRSGESSQGIVAPYLYIQVRLVDLATLEVRTQTITANGVVGAARNKEGTDAWGALTAEEKIMAAESLIKANVGQAVPALFAAK
jgi:hypothetical protein